MRAASSISIGFLLASTLVVGCTAGRYPSEFNIEKAARFFEEHRQSITVLLETVQKEGYERVAFLAPDMVRVNDTWPPLTGEKRDMFMRLFSDADVDKVYAFEGCYTLAGGHVPPPHLDGDVILVAPCRKRQTKETLCSEIERPVPPDGVCAAPLSAGWSLLYQWHTFK